MSLGSCGIANLAILQLGKFSGGGGKGLSMGWFGLQGTFLNPFRFSLPKRKLTMEEMVNKFIEEEKREHEEMEAFIGEFRTTNELLLKERNNSLSELEFEVYGIRKEKEETQQKKFLENQKQLHINIPFTEALAQMPKYAKFLKGLLSNKTRLEEACTVTMNERCSAVLLNKLPSKEKDPGSFTIPCDIGNLHIDNALADLVTSISLMPYTMYEKLGLGEPKPMRMSLELADRSIQYPRGIVGNVLIKIDKFILPIDFVILDMREDSRIPIILGRPFLATASAMIDVFNKKITLRVGDDEVTFDIEQSIKRLPAEDDECYGIDDLDKTIHLEAQELLEYDQMDSFLVNNLEKCVNQSNLKNCGDSEEPIRCITQVDTKTQEMQGSKRGQNDHLYSSPTNEIDEKKPELKELPPHLEYAYLKGNESCHDSSKFQSHQKIKKRQLLPVLM
ncbi:DNA-directed DNA polymerase [Tanacetum coccineum]|uniref:DNA-directed DNA polymerase n=1 Tax=Tanacetum coccineum TaxID=301880 RepID=A0ABQ4YV72_9ASTR